MTINRVLGSLVLVVAALGVTGCGNSKSGVVEARTAAETVNGLCPVREEPVVEENFLERDGQKIGFCCAPCKTEFLKTPDAFLTKMRDERERFGYVGK